MASREFPIVGDSLALGYRFQRYWNDSMATAFYFGELGAGLFLVSALYGSTIGMITGVAITAVLKTWFHMAHMGVPERAWRAILRPDRSWISRGLISIVCFSGTAILHILLTVFGADEGTFAWLVQLAAILSALVVMTYHGFAIADSPSISFWNTGLMPVSSLSYSALGGLALLGVLDRASGASGLGPLPSAHDASLLLVIVTFIIVLALMQGANRGSPGARKSLNLLIREGPYVKWFLGGVLLAGLVLPFVLLLVPTSFIVDLLFAALVLAGYYAFRVLVFKVGLYDPVISFAPES
jgi:DMSO reductase anchor subunit